MKNIQINIRPINNRKKQFVAYSQSNLLDATYAVIFNDNIYGNVALNSFAEMIRHKYDGVKIDFQVSAEEITFQNPALLEYLSPARKMMK